MPVRITVLIASITLLTGLLVAAFASALEHLSLSAPPEMALGIGLLPSNTPLVISLIMACSIGRWAYDAHVRIIENIAQQPLI